jgi:hypothetical protein
VDEMISNHASAGLSDDATTAEGAIPELSSSSQTSALHDEVAIKMEQVNTSNPITQSTVTRALAALQGDESTNGKYVHVCIVAWCDWREVDWSVYRE